MDRRPVIELGVLGLLAERDATATELKERFNHNFGRHQFAGHGTLGPTLDRLHEEEYLTGAQEYTLTERGRDRLRTLLREPVPAVDNPSHRPHLLVKLGFLHHLPPEDQAAELAYLEDQFHQARNSWVETLTMHEEEVTSHDGYRVELIELTVDLLDTQLEWVRRLRESVAD